MPLMYQLLTLPGPPPMQVDTPRDPGPTTPIERGPPDLKNPICKHGRTEVLP